MFFEQPSIETTLSIEDSGGCARPYGHTCRRFVNAHFIAAGRRNNDSGLRAKPTHMSRVFMGQSPGGALGARLAEGAAGGKGQAQNRDEPYAGRRAGAVETGPQAAKTCLKRAAARKTFSTRSGDYI